MSSTLIPIKDYLGKYFPELNYSSTQDKYKDTKLDSFFEQRFLIQSNKAQMIVDPDLRGLSIVIAGNEVHISKSLYDHSSVVVSNSLEQEQHLNPRNLYNSETFSTIAYLMCQNHVTLNIVDEIDEPIYVKYRSDFETFYSSVVVFRIEEDLEIEIVEEVESMSALNAITNYVLSPRSKLNLSTFYRNNITAISFYYRNVIAQTDSEFNHIMFGKGSASVIDENKIHVGPGSKTEMLGIINSDGRDFHTILCIDPPSEEFTVSVVYKDILKDKAHVSFFPVITRQNEFSEGATLEVSNISLDEIPEGERLIELNNFISDIAGRAELVRMVGAKRFYDSKERFLQIL